MEEDTNQPLTPLGNERRSNPGQTNIMRNSDGESIVPATPSWTDDTSLEDIAKQYSGVGGKYNDLVENAADNVGDRQVQLVGNDFGATNPYMFNTYYEPAATSFASEMRMQGTQKAVEVGIDRAEKEAQKRLEAAQSRYNNAVAAAKEKENQKKNANIHISETDKSKLPDNTSESELQSFYQMTEGMSDEEKRQKWIEFQTRKTQENSENIGWNEDWRSKYSTDFRRSRIDDATWANMSKEAREEWYARPDIGNAWTEGYMIEYYKKNYPDMANAMIDNFNTVRASADIIVNAINANDFSSVKYEDVVLPSLKLADPNNFSFENIKKAISDSDKISDEDKKRYLEYMDENKKYLQGTGGKGNTAVDKFMQRWEEIKSKQAVLGDNPDARTQMGVPSKVWLVNGQTIGAGGRLYDETLEIMQLFAENKDIVDMAGAKNAGVLKYSAASGSEGGNASGEYYLPEGKRLIDVVDQKTMDNTLSAAFGVDLDSFDKLTKMAAESPDDYNYLKDHCSFVLAGGAGAFETITDTNKKYYVDGKWWSASDENSPIKEGDLIFHSIDLPVDEDGKYLDDDLNDFIRMYKKIYSGDIEASDENLDALQKSYNRYANRVTRALILSSNQGVGINENLYSVLLSLDGKNEDDLSIVNPTDPEQKMSLAGFTEWFNGLSDDQKYDFYATVATKAREVRGVMILHDDASGQNYDAGIEQKGISTIGKYNVKNNGETRVIDFAKNLSNEDCLAIAFLLDNKLKDGKISSGFMDNEGVDIPEVGFNAIQTNLKGCAQFFGAAFNMAVGGVGLMLGIKDEDGINGAIHAADELWNDMTNITEADDWNHGSGDAALNPYTQQVREQQRANLNHMLDLTYNLHYFDVENKTDENGNVVNEKGEIQTLGNDHYTHMDQGKALASWTANMVGTIAEFALETAATAGIAKVFKLGAKAGFKFLGKGAQALAKTSPAMAKIIGTGSKFARWTTTALTTPVTITAVRSAVSSSKAAAFLQKVAIKYPSVVIEGILDGTINSLDDIIEVTNKAKGVVDDVANVADDAARGGAKAAANMADDVASNTAKQTGEQIAKDAAESADNIASSLSDDVARSAAESSPVDDVIKNMTEEEANNLINGVKEAQKTLQRDYALRNGLDMVVDNADDTARSLAGRIMDKIEKRLNGTYLFKGVNDSVRGLVKNGLVEAVQRSAVNARIAAKTGIAAERIALLSDDAANVVYGVIRAAETSSDNIAAKAIGLLDKQVAAAQDVVLKNIDLTKATEKVVEASEEMLLKHGQLKLDDVFRIFATEGATNAGELLNVLKRQDFLRDRIMDWSRDIAQNYWTPELDQNFESHYVDFDTYLHSPEQWVAGAIFDIGSTKLRGAAQRVKLYFTEKHINDILGDMDLTAANTADLAKFKKQMVKLDKLRLKATKLNSAIINRTISFDKVHDVADKAERAIHEHIGAVTADFDIESSVDLIMRNRDSVLAEQAEYLKDKGFKSRRKFKRVVADADEFNRLIVRGNERLMMAQEASDALQAAAQVRYMDIYRHSEVMHKLTGEQWGKVISISYKELLDNNFTDTIYERLKKELLDSGVPEADIPNKLAYRKTGDAFDAKRTINFKNRKYTKLAYEEGQKIVYDTIFKHVRDVMGDSLTLSEYRQLQTELIGICDRMVKAGNTVIDDGGNVRWNYFPGQAVTWEAVPGTSSAVRANWGYDYKGGGHSFFAGEVDNPSLARDTQDFVGILNDFDNGVETFKRKKGEKALEAERRDAAPGATVDEYRDVKYNWAGFDPSYACNAYLNSLDSARIIQPLLDPINGLVVTNKELAAAVMQVSDVTLNNELMYYEQRYQTKLGKELEKAKAENIKAHSAELAQRRANLISTLAANDNIQKAMAKGSNDRIAALEARDLEIDANTQKTIKKSGLVRAFEKLYKKNGVLDADGVAKGDEASYVLRRLSKSYDDIGADIKAVRGMLTEDGKVKPEFLDTDGTIKPEFVDVEGNLVAPNTSETFNRNNSRQYRNAINKLARQNDIEESIFAPNYGYTVVMDDGTRVNTEMFSEAIYETLAIKESTDVMYHPNDSGLDFSEVDAQIAKNRKNVVKQGAKYGNPEFLENDIVSRRLQPVSFDSDNARGVLTKEARKILNSIYGSITYDRGDYTVSGAMDEVIQSAINDAYDAVEARREEINAYDFVREVDKNIPDFIKKVDSPKAVESLNNILYVVGLYEKAGGTTDNLYGDLVAAYNSTDVPEEKAFLADAADTIRNLYNYNSRTTGRGAMDEGDVYTRTSGSDEANLDDDDFSDQVGVERQVDESHGINVADMDRRMFHTDENGNKIMDENWRSAAKDDSAPAATPELSGYVNHSGGAVGSDTVWGEIGEKYGVTSNHYYHGKKTPNGNHEISEADYLEGVEAVKKANKTLGRQPDKYMDLLARNYSQVKNADAVFAIGERQTQKIATGKVKMVNGGSAPMAKGGTGWAVQMAVDDGKPVYFFDQAANRWYTIANGKWQPIDTPTLTKNFAGIGTREINENGRKAIADVYAKTLEAKKDTPATSQPAGTFEASTAGHKEFSALNAKFAEGTKIMGIDIGGRTIEDVYQKELKGSGKGEAPAKDSVLGKATAQAEEKAGRALTKAEKESISQRYYDRLWDIWGEQNPELKAQIENLPAGTKITDKFAKTGVSQANSLQRWVPVSSSNIAADKAVNLMRALDYINANSGSKNAFKSNMTFDYDGEAQPFIVEKSTIDAIKTGKRTSTTRLKSQVGNRYDNLKVGDIVEFRGKDNDTVLVKITKAPKEIDPSNMSDVEFESLLQREGWSEKGYNSIITDKVNAGDKAIQFEYKLAGSDWAQRRNYRNVRSKVFKDTVESFNKIADILDNKVADKEGLGHVDDVLKIEKDKIYSPAQVNKFLHEKNATISDKTVARLKEYKTTYEYFLNAKNAKNPKPDSIKKMKEKVAREYAALAENVNYDNSVFNRMAREEKGTAIYRGSTFLRGANDSQYLSFASGNHTSNWGYQWAGRNTYKPDGTVGSVYNNSVNTIEARNAILAGVDGYGNIEFMSPSRIKKFIKDNGITITADEEKIIDNYSSKYEAAKQLVLDKNHRRNISDTTVDMGSSILRYLSSFNEVDADGKNIYSSFDNVTNEDDYYRSETDRYINDKAGKKEIRKIEKQFAKSSKKGSDKIEFDDKEVSERAAEYVNNRSDDVYLGERQGYGELDSPETMYDFDSREAVAAVKKDAQAYVDEHIDEFLKKDEEYQQLVAWHEKVKKSKNKKDIAMVEEYMATRKKEVADEYLPAIEKRMEKSAQVDAESLKAQRNKPGYRRPDDDQKTYIDDYSDDRDEINYAKNEFNPYLAYSPYTEFLDASKEENISKAQSDFFTLMFGDGDNDGYFDTKNNIKKQKEDTLASVQEAFDNTITDKVTELKQLNGAKDDEVIGILQAARKQAEDLTSETMRNYVIGRIDEEIDFVNKNLELTPETKVKVARELAQHDPAYKAALAMKKMNSAKPTGNEVAAAVPTGSSPIYVNGNMAPEGHITLQQLIDAQKVHKLSRNKWNGKNNVISSYQDKQVLKEMRKGGSSFTEGSARQQNNWICKLYARIMNYALEDPLPSTPTLDDIEKGFMMTKDGKKILLPLRLDEVYIDPKIAALGHTYWGEGRSKNIKRFHDMSNTISSFNKAVQDVQLAGGIGQYNAFTLRNAVTMMWRDPIGGTRALFSNFYNARSNESVISFYLDNHEKLLKMAMDSGDYSALNAFTNVINAYDEVGGRGMISEFGRTIMDIPNSVKQNGVRLGLWESTKGAYEAIFQNPTFVRWAAVAKADMQLRNYDKATKFVNRIIRRYNLKPEDFDKMAGGQGNVDRYIAHIANMRTERYWNPGRMAKAGWNTEKYLDNQEQLRLKQTTEAIRGMPQKKTLRQCLGDYFFAISYKLQMNAHPLVGIGQIFTALPSDIRAAHGLRSRTSFIPMSSRFAGRGDRTQALVMIGIAGLAHFYNTSIGAPSAFEEVFGDHGDEKNGTYGLAQSLLNFQDFGKIWLPNTNNGKFDTTKSGYAIDPFFSVFTLQNSVFRATNKAFFPNQIPRNTQRTFGAGLLQVNSGQPVIGAPEPGSFWDRAGGVMDELVGANLLSGYKAIYEVLNNNTYFGNNIWERKYLSDGSVNPNYDPLRNVMASVAHILNLEELMLGDTTNRWVKGLDIEAGIGPQIGKPGKYNGRTGTVAGSGIIQHEYLTAFKHIDNGDYFEALTESMELPIKSRNFAAKARTQLNTEVVAALRQAKLDYDHKVEGATPEEKDAYYAEFAGKAVNIMHDWSAKNSYALGRNDELTASATKIVMAFMLDEYDDVTNRVQNRYDLLKQELKMADGDQFLFTKEALEAAKKGPGGDQMTDAEWAEMQNKHLTALKNAQIKEYEARQKLLEAGIDPSVFDTADYVNDDISAKTASFDKKTYREIIGKLESPVGEFKNFKEMKAYYEARIAEATTTKAKAKLANMYNQYVTDIVSPYVGEGYAAAAFNNIYWDGDNLSNKLGQYIILPADQYYGGKTPRTNYLKNMLGIGFANKNHPEYNKNLPSDKDVQEQLNKVAVALSRGNISSASALVDNALLQLRKGYNHASPEDYEKLIRMRALLSSRSR